MKICPKCGKQCADESKFCIACGTPLGNASPPPVMPPNAGSQSPQPEKKGRKGLIPLIIAAVIVVIVAVAVIFVFVFRSKSSDGGSGGNNDSGWDDVSADDDNKDDSREDEKDDEDDESRDDNEKDRDDESRTDDENDSDEESDSENEEDEDADDALSDSEARALSDYTDHSYLIEVDDVDWNEAKDRAEQLGAHLVTFDSEAELEHVLELIEEKTEETDVHYVYYIGASRLGRGDNYYWLSDDGNYYGDSINPADCDWLEDYWLDGEPSYSSDGEQEAYVELMYVGGQWVLNDIPADVTGYYPGKVAYIVEWDY